MTKNQFIQQIWSSYLRMKSSGIVKLPTLIFVISACTLFATHGYAQAGRSPQSLQISGTVTGAQGEPLVGALVTEDGTSNGAMADAGGAYRITVSAGATLSFAHVGYTTKTVVVTAAGPLNVVLSEDTQMLDEVVVVGYGVQKRASVTGSVASVRSKEITSVKTPNVTNALAGKLPGLRAVQRSGAPGDDAASLDIRGFGSALIIVDGVERSFNQIDANDIESISILKDASASVYGFKGANGVILITTKKGEVSKPKITYNGYFGIQNITRYPEMLDGYEYATLYNEAQQNVGVTAPYSEEDLERFRQGIGTTDWYDATIRKAVPQTYHNIGVSGGTEQVKYFFSLGYTYQEGIYKSGDYDYSRYNIRSNISTKIVDGLTIGLQVSGRFDARNKPYEYEGGLIMRSIQMAKPVFPMFANNNENYWSSPGDKGNPYHISRYDGVGYDKRDRREFNGALTLDWEIPWLKGLQAKAQLSYDYNNLWSRRWYKEFYEYSYNPTNDTYNVQTNHTLSELTTRSENYFNPNVQLSLNYSNTFGLHDIGAMALWEVDNDRKDWVEAYRQFDVAALDQIDAGNKANMNNAGRARVSAHAGLVGRVTYAYASKYLAELSFRYDGSYKFAPESRWGFFPAVSLGWRISEEPFFKEALPAIDNLKIRGSFGVIGDEGTVGDADDWRNYQYLSGYTYPSGNYVLGSGGLSNGASDRGLPNATLTWYESKTANIGFEASVRSGLLSVEFDYFVRKREGLLATRLLTLPSTFGQSLPEENLNSDKTAGFEIVLGHRNKVGDFTYDVKANFSTTRESNDYVERAASSNSLTNWRNNSNDRFKYIAWGREVIGQFQSYEDILNSPIQDGNGNKSLLPGDLKFRDVNNDGIINGSDDLPLSTGDTPRFYYGLNINAAYKGFDVTIFLQGAGGHRVSTASDFMDPFIQQGLGNGITLQLDRWHRADASDPNSEWIPGYMPPLRPAGVGANRTTNSWNLHKADYLRLKTLELGYTLPQSVLTKTGVENLRVYVSAFNLLTLTNNEGLMKYMDPENSHSSLRYYPQMKTFNIGATLTF